MTGEQEVWPWYPSSVDVLHIVDIVAASEALIYQLLSAVLLQEIHVKEAYYILYKLHII